MSNQKIDFAEDKKIALRKTCLRDFFVFCQTVMGYDDITNIHADYCWFLEGPESRKQAEMPRGFIKTYIGTVAYSIWITLPRKDADEFPVGIISDDPFYSLGPNMRILVASYVVANAMKMIGLIRKTYERNSLFRFLFSDVVPENFQKVKWSDTEACIKRDKDFTECTFEAGGIGGSTTSRHYDLIIEDDLIYACKDDFSGRELQPNQEDIDKAIGWHKLAMSLLVPGNHTRIHNIGCLVEGTKVLMSSGEWRQIQDVKVGEEVYSVDNGKLSSRLVEAVIPQGESEVVEVRTLGTTVKCTPNHPFLVLRDNQLEFVRADQLGHNEKVVSIESIPNSGKECPISNEEASWFLGFMFGDGWVTIGKNERRYAICAAYGIDKEQNDKFIRIAKEQFEINFKHTLFGYARSDQTNPARELIKLGFIGKAKTKRLPEWLFKAPKNIKQSFIEGFISADGTNVQGQFAVEISNYELLNDLRLLAMTCGFPTTNIYSRKRISQAPHSKFPIESESSHAYFTTKVHNHRSALMRHKTLRKTHLDKYLRFDTVRYVKPIEGKRTVWDLTIQGTHNFISEGLCTHNTRWAKHDLIDYIRANEPDYVVFARAATKDRTFTSHSEPTWPEMYDLKKLDQIRRAQGPFLFATQYLGQPTVPEDKLFKREWLQFYKSQYELPKQEEMRIFTTIDLSLWSHTKRKGHDSRGVVLTCGWDRYNNVWILHYDAARFDPSEIIDQMYKHYKLFHPEMIGVESVYYQKSLMHFLHKDMEKRGWLPVRELQTDSSVSKDLRIRALEPYAMNLAIHCREDHEDFITEFMEYTPDNNGVTKDILDALSYQLQVARPGSVQSKVRIKPVGDLVITTGTVEEFLNHAWNKDKKKSEEVFSEYRPIDNPYDDSRISEMFHNPFEE